MSKWTYIVGAICVDTYSEDAINKVKEFLVNAPIITGSERDAEIFLNQPSGHNCAEYGWDENLNQPFEKEWETRVILSIFGTLRDKTIYKTRKEFKAFVNELQKQFDIEYQSVKITL